MSYKEITLQKVDQIKQLLARNLSQHQVASIAGCSQSTVNKIYNGTYICGEGKKAKAKPKQDYQYFKWENYL